MVRAITQGDHSTAVSNAGTVIDIEKSIGIFWEPAMQGAIVGERGLVHFFNWFYVLGFFPFIGLMALVLFLYRPELYRLLRNAVFISGAIGLIIFMTFPVAPPRFVGLNVIDSVAANSVAYQLLLPSDFVNEYAAVPSFHFGWTLLAGLALVAQFRPWPIKLVGILMPTLMFLTIVFTAHHYILDPVFGGAVAIFGLVLAKNLHKFQPSRLSALPALLLRR